MHEGTGAAPATRWAAVARIERRVGWISICLGALSMVSWKLLDGDEHRFVILLLLGPAAFLGGGLLVVAGRALQHPGPRAFVGQGLLVGFVVYWYVLLFT